MMRLLRFVPAVLWATLIFTLSAQSRLPELPVTFDGIDKLAHCLVFGILCALVVYGVGHRGRQALIAGIVATSLYGCLDEIHQIFVPGRSPDVLDWLADTIGASLAALVIHRVKRKP